MSSLRAPALAVLLSIVSALPATAQDIVRGQRTRIISCPAAHPMYPNLRGLSPEDKERLLFHLSYRFSRQPEHFQRPGGLTFEQLKAMLEANPALMQSFKYMQETGGEPDLIEVTDTELVFADTYVEAPRVNLTYPEASTMAFEMGVQLIDEATYEKMRRLAQEGWQFDQKTSTWIASGVGDLGNGQAKVGSGAGITRQPECDRSPSRGARFVLRLPRT